MKNTCKNCTKRHMKCHATCEQYKAFAEERKRIREQMQADIKADYQAKVNWSNSNWRV